MRRSRYLFRQLIKLVAAVSVPLLLLQAYNLYHESQQAREAAYRAVENYATSVAQGAETQLDDTKQYLAFLAARPLILALNREQCDPLLEGVTKRRRHVANVFIADVAGRPVCFSVKGPGAIPDTLTSFDWFRQASAGESMTVSKPFLAPVVQRMVSAVSQPLRDANGVRIGTATVLLDLESMQNEWARYSLPSNSRISIFHADGTVLATRPDFQTLIGKDASAAIRNAKALNPGDVGVAPGLDGVERAFALRPVPTSNWQAGVAIPTDYVFGPYRAQLKNTLTITALVLAAIFASAFFMARRMVAPLSNLVETARAVGRGQAGVRASEAVPGEFREVAHEFNAMLDAGRRHLDFYKALSRTNGAIVRMANAAALYDEICRICVEHGHASIAYVSLVEGDTMTHVAWAGPALEFVQGLDVRPGDGGAMRSGLSGLAAWSGVRQISNDVHEDPRTVPWRKIGDAIGTKSIAACPFRRGGLTVGTLTLHMTVAGFFDDRVTALLDEMTEDISFALDNFEREKSLVRREQQLAGLVDTAMDAIISIDGAYRIRLFNRAAGEMFQVEPNDVLGSTVDRFIPERLHSAHAVHLEHFARTGSTARRMGIHSLVARRSDGSEFPIEASISKLGQGEAVLMTVVIRDATEMRLAQQARIAQLAAESASRAKTEFLSRMSHELRTPLNAVLGFSQLMQSDTKEPLTTGQFGHVERIRQAGWHLLALINDVLDVSKIEGGHVSLEEQRVSLLESLDEAVRINQPGADAAGIRMIATYRSAPSSFVLADPRRLRQVMINLLSNGIKYNRPNGTVEIRVSSDASDTRIDVIDTGMGMNAAQLEHLYEPFNRLGRERNAIEGTGLGLALTRQLVQLMGGTIEVQSTVGLGTQIRVTLRTQGEAEAPGTPLVREPARNDASDDVPPEGVVLYIEDNPVNFMLVEHLLLRWPKVTLLHAETGRGGLTIAQTTSLDLILLDMRLPDMDGLAVLHALRDSPKTEKTRVVALSASAMPEELASAEGAGAHQYWTKPLDFDLFIRQMQALLANK